MHTLWRDKRYWVQYLEWNTLAGLQKVNSFQDLFAQLIQLGGEDGDAKVQQIRREMESYHRKLTLHAVGWWAEAVAFNFKGEEM